MYMDNDHLDAALEVANARIKQLLEVIETLRQLRKYDQLTIDRLTKALSEGD